MSMLDQIMDIIYTKTIREEEGATYGVEVSGNINNYPYGIFSLYVYFDTNPQLIDKMIGKVKQGLDDIVKNGPSEADLNKTKEYMLKNYGEAQRTNSHWLSAIDSYYTWGIDKQNGFDAKIKAITVNDIKEFTAKLLAQKNEIDVIMNGVEKK
jgi:zinc protease